MRCGQYRNVLPKLLKNPVLIGYSEDVAAVAGILGAKARSNERCIAERCEKLR